MINATDITYIIVHCTDSNRDTTTFEQVNSWHKANGWKAEKSGVNIGYHYFIDGQGRLYSGRKRYGNYVEQGSHAKGLNYCSIGICLALKNGQSPSDKQLSQLKTLIKKLKEDPKEKYPNLKQVIGHRDVAKITKKPELATECPTLNLYKEVLRIRKELNLEGK